MKTTLEWLSILPDGYRERATAQVANAWANDEVSSLPKALANMKVWGETNEGGHFWQAVCNHYCNGTPLPPLPEPVALKATIGWLSRLPDGYRERAVVQVQESRFNAMVPNMCDALVNMKAWGDTNEGVYFWRAVGNHYRNGTPLPPLPVEPKSVSDWLSQLPAGYKELAISQARHLSARVTSMGEALASVQPWNKTEEGESFWSKVYFHYATGAKLPSLPEPVTVEDLETYHLGNMTEERDNWYKRAMSNKERITALEDRLMKRQKKVQDLEDTLRKMAKELDDWKKTATDRRAKIADLEDHLKKLAKRIVYDTCEREIRAKAAALKSHLAKERVKKLDELRSLLR